MARVMHPRSVLLGMVAFQAMWVACALGIEVPYVATEDGGDEGGPRRSVSLSSVPSLPLTAGEPLVPPWLDCATATAGTEAPSVTVRRRL